MVVTGEPPLRRWAGATITVMGGKTRRLWPVAAIVVVIALAGALVWGVWRSPHRDDLSTFGAFAVAVIVPMVSLIIYLTKVRQRGDAGPGDAGQGRMLNELADALAGAVTEQWTRAAAERRLLQPEPIPVHWVRSSRPLAGPVSAAAKSRRFPPVPGLPAAGLDQLRNGGLQDLHAVYGGLGSGRLVIVGTPGSGKSGAAVLLILAALKHRAQMPKKDRQRVPVLFTVHGWDPSTQQVGDWLAERLQQTYPLFAGRGGKAAAAELVRATRIAVILDGLDEIPEELRPAALQALSDKADFRVVVLGRSDETAAASRLTFLVGAVALELQDVDPKVAADYLTNVQRDPAPAGWGELTNRLRRAPGSPIARALSLPLTLTLVRDTYRGGDDVRELLDFCDAAGHGVSREDIEDYLLDRVLPAAYAPRPGEAPPRYELQAAQRALGQIAARMNQDGTRDLAWWRIPAWASAAPRVIATGLVFGLLFGLGGPVFGLVAGLMAALVYALGGGLKGRPPLRIARLRWRQLFSGSSLVGMLVLGLVFGLAAGLVFGLVGGLRSGLVFGLRSGLVFGLASGLVFGLVAGLAGGLSQPGADNASPATPAASWRRDQAFGLAFGLVLGLAFGLVLGLLAAHVALGLVFGLMFGLLFGLWFPETWRASLAFAQLAMRWHTPARLMRFLEDAREREILRTVGPVYQFRHARLQDRLAGRSHL